MKKLIISLVILLIVIIFGIVLMGNKYGNSNALPSESSGFENLGTPSASSLDGLSQEEIDRLVGGEAYHNTMDYSQFHGPAICNVSGMVTFTDRFTARIDNAFFKYSGIDSPARQIVWSISPADGLRVGPNIAASLDLPDGSAQIGVVLPENPKNKKYTLTASITYGRLEEGGVVVKETDCRGSTKVILDF